MENEHNIPAVVSVGDNPTKLWGLTMAERTGRLAKAQGLPTESVGPVILANADFAFDPLWFRHIVANPRLMVTVGGVPALAHAVDAASAQDVRHAMETRRAPSDGAAFTVVRFEDGPMIEDKQLRKRNTPFLMALTPDTVRQIERDSYSGAYKGVTDLLTKYLWPEWAFVLTRIAAKLRITPNMITVVGAIMCVAATFAFAYGHYWLGMAMGLVFMVFDTVDGKLARCTITSSKLGNVLDHGMDLVHPPFWWWFWAIGLTYWGLGLSGQTFWLVQLAIQGGYVVQRLIEGAFMARNDQMHIHVWRPFDSWFRLITARRNPNMVILFVSMLFARPDIGIIAVAWWTVISLIVHMVQLVQAETARKRGGGHLTSWLAGEGA
ncbi:CDP-alcohol phosphatidyltransferase family protein [Croceicoccus ponticola]|uniref:CDP-alcohol phosphatidyltransferase family protein n=1 Tax=Croceicoccus ponticola TaxID=2217664 RepID=A0A437H094_9SPHN|nr:CDP-alcohol phosphatidyltransferase family protein [Croceicoccus ponticola]RVQ69025.1 CDP-alcohol phosphatidyltransferase family protein [Croceicoccus ponticola]